MRSLPSMWWTGVHVEISGHPGWIFHGFLGFGHLPENLITFLITASLAFGHPRSAWKAQGNQCEPCLVSLSPKPPAAPARGASWCLLCSVGGEGGGAAPTLLCCSLQPRLILFKTGSPSCPSDVLSWVEHRFGNSRVSLDTHICVRVSKSSDSSFPASLFCTVVPALPPLVPQTLHMCLSAQQTLVSTSLCM